MKTTTPRAALRARHSAIPMSAMVISIALAIAVAPEPARAQSAPETPVQIRIAAQPLSKALLQLGEQTSLQIFYSQETVDGLSAPAVAGTLLPEDALRRLLAGSGIAFHRTGKNISLTRPAPGNEATTLAPVQVQAELSNNWDAPAEYAGGQVASGARLGTLGNLGVMDAPFSISGYTAKKIEEEQSLTVADVLNNDPSVRVRNNTLTSGNVEGDVFFIRGFAVYGSDILFDGLYGVAPRLSYPVEGLERVEVLRGPNAFLNGMSASGGIGGAVNVVPKRATDDPITRLTTTYVSDGNIGGHLDMGRRFGDANQWGIRFNGSYKDGATATNGQSLQFGTATLGLDYRSERFRASLDAGYLDRDLEGSAVYSFNISRTLPAVPQAPDPRKRFGQEWEYGKSRSSFVVGKAEYDLTPDWTVSGALGYGKSASDTLLSQISISDMDGSATAAVARSRSSSHSSSGQLGLRGRFETGALTHKINLSGALSHQNAGTNDGSNEGYGWGWIRYPTNIYDPQRVAKPSLAGFPDDVPKTSTTLFTFYALSDTLSVLDERIQLTLGGRYQEVRTDSYSAATGERNSRYKSHAFTPAVGLVVKPVENLSLYANYIEGLQPGSIVGESYSNAGEVLPPFVSKQIELGSKYDFGSFSLTGALFQIEQSNAIVTDDPSTGQQSYNANGQVKHRGIEVSGYGEIAKGLRMIAGVTWLHARLEKTQGGATDGNSASNVPQWQGNLGIDWDTPFMAGLTLSGRMISTGRVYIRTDNGLQSPGWTRFDLGARYTTKAFNKPLTLRFNIENVGNKRYWAASSGNSFLGSPRVFKLSASMDF